MSTWFKFKSFPFYCDIHEQSPASFALLLYWGHSAEECRRKFVTKTTFVMRHFKLGWKGWELFPGKMTGKEEGSEAKLRLIIGDELNFASCKQPACLQLEGKGWHSQRRHWMVCRGWKSACYEKEGHWAQEQLGGSCTSEQEKWEEVASYQWSSWNQEKYVQYAVIPSRVTRFINTLKEAGTLQRTAHDT